MRQVSSAYCSKLILLWGGVEAIAKLRIAPDNGVHQGVHYRVEDDGREGVTLVDSKLQMDRGRGP